MSSNKSNFSGKIQKCHFLQAGNFHTSPPVCHGEVQLIIPQEIKIINSNPDKKRKIPEKIGDFLSFFCLFARDFYRRNMVFFLAGGAAEVAQGGVVLLAVDIGLPQLAMHPANECFAAADYEEMQTALTAFFSSNISINGNEVKTN